MGKKKKKRHLDWWEKNNKPKRLVEHAKQTNPGQNEQGLTAKDHRKRSRPVLLVSLFEALAILRGIVFA